MVINYVRKFDNTGPNLQLDDSGGILLWDDDEEIFKNNWFILNTCCAVCIQLEVYIPKLFFQDKTGRDWRSLPESPGPRRDYICLVLLLRTIREKFVTGRDYSVTLEKFLNGHEMN